MTSKQEPYCKANAILNSQNSGPNFESLKVTTDESTLSESVQAQPVRFMCPACSFPESLSLPYPYPVSRRMDLIRPPNAKAGFGG